MGVVSHPLVFLLYVNFAVLVVASSEVLVAKHVTGFFLATSKYLCARVVRANCVGFYCCRLHFVLLFSIFLLPIYNTKVRL